MNLGLGLLSVGIVVAGRWGRKQTMDARVVIALFFLLLAVTAVSNLDNEVGAAFTALVFFALLYAYGPDILNRVREVTK